MHSKKCLANLTGYTKLSKSRNLIKQHKPPFECNVCSIFQTKHKVYIFIRIGINRKPQKWRENWVDTNILVEVEHLLFTSNLKPLAWNDVWDIFA